MFRPICKIKMFIYQHLSGDLSLALCSASALKFSVDGRSVGGAGEIRIYQYKADWSSRIGAYLNTHSGTTQKRYRVKYSSSI